MTGGRAAAPRAGTVGPLVFAALAIGLGWLVALPLHLGDGLESPAFGVLAIVFMCTPAIAALVTARFVAGTRGVWRSLGAWPLAPASRLLAWLAVAFGVCLAVVLAALPVGALLGVYPADFVSLSEFAALVDGQLAAAGLPAGSQPVLGLALVQLAMIVPASLVNMFPAFGEELGWRGCLYPRLRRLGAAPAVVVTGVVWGVWHAPLLLLGYNYPGAEPALAIAAMCGMCIVLGGVLAWLRERSGSVWPAALGHGVVNAAAGSTMVLFAAAGEPVDTLQAGILGWSGWIVPGILVVVLLAVGAYRGPRPRAVPVFDIEGADAGSGPVVGSSA